MAVEAIRAALLGDLPHGFLGRRGGVSTGLCAGLNVGLGSGDDRDAIRANRALAIAAVAPGAELVTLHQVHSADAIAVTSPFADDARPHADAMVTDRPGLALGILTADCTPILFADRDAGVIGAAHAGWKGAIGGVVAATVEAMERLGADRARIVAAVGPTIARKSYEVDEAFFQRFTAEDARNERFFSAGKPGRHQFDLEAFVLARVGEAGIGRVEALGEDTYSQPDRFYSYRRATHRGEPDYGRQTSLIALP
ncbi:MAG TPA: peptidoglycan editing factor PgeF [Allosphingosinicella sp.]|jgi:hypothetical protein